MSPGYSIYLIAKAADTWHYAWLMLKVVCTIIDFVCLGAVVKVSALPTLSSAPGWKELYKAALFENDKSRIVRKIAEAQAAIVAERQILLMSGANIKERQALDTALLSLQALANCFSTAPNLVSEVRAASVRPMDVRAA